MIVNSGAMKIGSVKGILHCGTVFLSLSLGVNHTEAKFPEGFFVC